MGDEYEVDGTSQDKQTIGSTVSAPDAKKLEQQLTKESNTPANVRIDTENKKVVVRRLLND